MCGTGLAALGGLRGAEKCPIPPPAAQGTSHPSKGTGKMLAATSSPPCLLQGAVAAPSSLQHPLKRRKSCVPSWCAEKDQSLSWSSRAWRKDGGKHTGGEALVSRGKVGM